ncbi:uncharacterized protein LOC112574996 [Pomacea canaliculata]|nr:uncharacterized protein LOC112574996 [Pomacea canaliculata]
MAFLAEKRGCYRFGVLLVMAGLALYITGFSVSFWAFVTVNQTNMYRFGLWDVCRTLPSSSHSTLYVCTTVNGSINYHRAAQALQCVGLAVMSLSLALGLLLNFSVPRIFLLSRLQEISSGVGSLTGFSGAMIFVKEIEQIKRDLLFRAPGEKPSVSYDWGFALNVTGSILCILATIIICMSNRPDASSSTTDTASDLRVVHSSSRRRASDGERSGIANPAFYRNHVISSTYDRDHVTSTANPRYDRDRSTRSSSGGSTISVISKDHVIKSTSNRSLEKESVPSLKLSQKSSIHKVSPPRVPGLEKYNSSSSVSTVV